MLPHPAKRKHRIAFVVILIVIVVTVASVSQLRVYQMASPSMEPVIRGSTVSSGGGEWVLTIKTHRTEIKRNDLVVVAFIINGVRVRTVRRVAAAPGDVFASPTDGSRTTQLSNDFFYLVAES